jgi:Amt family ammonium transporter
VHGAAGILGTLAIGLFADSSLTFSGQGGLLTGGDASLFGTQLLGVVAVAIWVGATSFVMFGALKAVGRLRVSHKADALGMDVYEHGASLWPDVLPLADEDTKGAKGAGAMAPAVGD